MQCYHCHTTIELEKTPHRGETCPQCASYLHCCRNCRFYDPNAHNQCREPQADWVKEKEMANFCDFFAVAAGSTVGESARKQDARDKLDQLFKKK